MSPVHPTVQLIGRRLEPGDHAMRDVLTRAAQPHEWIDSGSPEAIGGAELARLAGRQAERFGAELVLLRGVEGGGPDGDRPRFKIAGGYEVTAEVALAS